MVYFVEDDNSIRELVVYTLEQTGIGAEGFALPSDFWRAMESRTPSLVLLDIMLPGEDGLQILKKLRSAPSTEKIPVIILSAKDSEYDKVTGLDCGADDYMPKPFGMMELTARIRALLRRSDAGRREGEYSVGGLTVNTRSRTVTADGREILLTYKEFELLRLLAENINTVMTRDVLLDRVWGYSYEGESRTVDVHIGTLRAKLGRAGDMIETVRGVGYKMRTAEHE